MTDSDKLIFEASWEVCHKIGGIYTVVKSKAALLAEKYENYFLIGPYFERNALLDLEEIDPPEFLKEIFNALKPEGITCHYGTWNIKGEPKTILIDFSEYWSHKDEIKKNMWDEFQVDSLGDDHEFDEAVVWASAVGRLIEKIIKTKPNKKAVCHCHEWLAGAALLYLKRAKVKIGTIFTTHATMLGRSIAGSGEKLYENLKTINPEEAARQHNILNKWSMEKACATNAEAFTTVSEITALEAEYLLGRKADVLLLNGLDMSKMPTYEDVAVSHKKNRESLREFLRYYFLPYDYFDVDDTCLMFIVGRYEFHNKGIDLLIKALAKLNDKMKEEGMTRTVICFFWIPREVHGTRTDVSNNKISYREMKDFIHENLHDVETNIVTNIIKTGTTKLTVDSISKDIFTPEMISAIKRREVNFVKQGNPPLSTHNIPYEEQDSIIQNLLQAGLDNKPDDRVKAIFYPIYLTGVDGLTDLGYYDAMNACHLGLFPSYYEPWGYTPLEAAAVGVPSVTTDLSGFGQFLKQKTSADSGIFVLDRMNRPWDDVVNDFSDLLYKFTKFNPQERVQQKILAKEMSNLADWKSFIKNYFDAHALAIKKVYGE